MKLNHLRGRKIIKKKPKRNDLIDVDIQVKDENLAKEIIKQYEEPPRYSPSLSGSNVTYKKDKILRSSRIVSTRNNSTTPRKSQILNNPRVVYKRMMSCQDL